MTNNASNIFEIPKPTIYSSLMDLAGLVVEATQIEEEENEPEETPASDSTARSEQGVEPPTPDSPAQSKQSEKKRFEVRDDGVFHNGVDRDGKPKPELRLCDRLDILAKTRDGKSAEWGRLLKWKDDDGVSHVWAMPNELLQSDGVAVRSELARLGLSIAPGRNAHDLLLTYLQTWEVDGRAFCVDRLGWHGSVYVVPSETIGDDAVQVVFQNSHAIEPAFSDAGTAEDWRDNVAAITRGNSRLMFAICVAFAGPLLEPAGGDSGGFHLRGPSSTGKSTALKVAASVWGLPSRYARLWRATSNGLESLASLHNDGLLILDELGQIDPREAGAAAYLLANGQGKARASRNGTARQSQSWRLLYLSAGEESLVSLMATAGRKVTAGQEIRLADIEADAGAGMGVLENLNGCATAAELIEILRNTTSRYYGAVGAGWLRWVVLNRPLLTAFIADGIRQFVGEHSSSDGQVERVARRFALVAVAGELVTNAGFTGWQEGEAAEAVGKCFEAWRESFGGDAGNREERTLLASVKAFFELHGESRFEGLHSTNGQRINNKAGFSRPVPDTNGRQEYLVFPEVFRNEVCKGFELKAAAKVLRTHGWLIPGNDGRNEQKARLPGIGMAWVYCIGPKVWEA